MSAIEAVIAELASEPLLWWGHQVEQGWVVLDRLDGRNRGGESRHLVRCRDWTPLEVSRTEFSSGQFTYFKIHLAALPEARVQEACNQLLVLHREFAGRAAYFRVTVEELERRRREAERQAFMTDSWPTSDEPSEMLDCLAGNITVRKLRLFDIACCRHIWRTIKDKDCRQAIQMAEQMVEGEIAPDEARRLAEELEQTRRTTIRTEDLNEPQTNTRIWCLSAARSLLQAVDIPLLLSDDGLLSTRRFVETAFIHSHVKSYDDPPTRKVVNERRAQANLLREILGQPSRPVAFDPRWRTPTVLIMAGTTYAERKFEDLPIMADALEEAGCSVAEILEHCRGNHPHVRGCWALDLILEKC
jgi:hypothetical protein